MKYSYYQIQKPYFRKNMNIGYIAITIDGYIADNAGNVGFLDNFGHIDTGYDDFIETIDVIIMGRGSYEAILGFGMDWPYPAQSTWVITQDKSLPTPHESIHFWHDDLQSLMAHLALKDNENCWFLGGGKLISDAIYNGLLDRLELFIIPTLLGSGIPLFPENNHALKSLTLNKVTFIGQAISHHSYCFQHSE